MVWLGGGGRELVMAVAVGRSSSSSDSSAMDVVGRGGIVEILEVGFVLVMKPVFTESGTAGTVDNEGRLEGCTTGTAGTVDAALAGFADGKAAGCVAGTVPAGAAGGGGGDGGGAAAGAGAGVPSLSVIPSSSSLSGSSPGSRLMPGRSWISKSEASGRPGKEILRRIWRLRRNPIVSLSAIEREQMFVG